MGCFDSRRAGEQVSDPRRRAARGTPHPSGKPAPETPPPPAAAISAPPTCVGSPVVQRRQRQVALLARGVPGGAGGRRWRRPALAQNGERPRLQASKDAGSATLQTRHTRLQLHLDPSRFVGQPTHQISNLRDLPSGVVIWWLMNAAPTVILLASSNCPRTYRSTRHDLPTPLSPSRTSLTRGGGPPSPGAPPSPCCAPAAAAALAPLRPGRGGAVWICTAGGRARRAQQPAEVTSAGRCADSRHRAAVDPRALQHQRVRQRRRRARSCALAACPAARQWHQICILHGPPAAGLLLEHPIRCGLRARVSQGCVGVYVYVCSVRCQRFESAGLGKPALANLNCIDARGRTPPEGRKLPGCMWK